MSIKLKDAQEMGDKKLRVVKSSPINEVLKTIMKTKKEALPIHEFMAEIKKLPEYEKLFQTADKAMITNGKINTSRLLKTRLNDMCYNSAGKQVSVVRIFDEKSKLHHWYLDEKPDLNKEIGKKK